MSTRLSVTVGLLRGGSIIVASRLLPSSLAVRRFEIGEEISSVDGDSSRKSGVYSCLELRFYSPVVRVPRPLLPAPPTPFLNAIS